MVKVVDMREALQQVREKAPNTADAMKRYKSGNAGFTDKAHLKAKGLIPRADGTKKVSPKYEGLNEISPDMRKFELEKQYKMILKDMPASERNTKAGKIKAMDLARVTATRAPGMTMRDLKILQKNKGTLKLEDLNQDEFIPEGMMKRLIGAVQDKLSKEGGAAGFADLAKAAKSMGVTLTKDMLKDMPGVKQHRDGDYILENKSSELINLYQIKNKTPEIEARIAKLEKELKVIKREETELEEAFTLADYRKLEADNQHAEAAAKLVNQYGTPEEKKEIAAINARHKKTGYISGPDFKRRVQISNKYYSRLK